MFLQKIEACISEMSRGNYFGVSQLAGMLQLSTQQLSRKTLTVAGITPGKLLTDYRIGYARQLLLESNETIKIIASKCGFSTPASFNRCFYKYFQCSPSRFRKRSFPDYGKAGTEPGSTHPALGLSSLKELILSKTWVLELAKIILDNIDNPELTVAQLAGTVHVSTSSLNRNLKKALALTPREFIKKLRLLYACELLGKKKCSISEVAYRAGFFDPAHLSRSFKTVFGYPPSEFLIKCGDELSISWIAEL